MANASFRVFFSPGSGWLGMLFRLRSAFVRAGFDHQVRAILDTGPITIKPAPLTFVSMVRSNDVLMFLLAIKSVYRFVGEGGICVILDRDAPASAHQILERHIPGVEIVYLEDIEVGPCQRGGTWERILYILDRSQSDYVVQVDADVLAVRPLPEVQEAYRQNRSFTMPQDESGLTTMAETAEHSRRRNHPHVTHQAQAAFARYPGADRVKYIRGSSGFAGFAKGGFKRAQAEAFSLKINELIGAKWLEWGSEQVMSNFAVANSPNPMILPLAKYACFDPVAVEAPAPAACYHFIGTFRYSRGYYAKQGKRVIQDLRLSAEAVS